MLRPPRSLPQPGPRLSELLTRRSSMPAAALQLRLLTLTDADSVPIRGGSEKSGE
jgi:hypothetical protein